MSAAGKWRSISIPLLIVISSCCYSQSVLSADTIGVKELRRQVALSQDSINELLEEKPHLHDQLFDILVQQEEKAIAKNKSKAALQTSVYVIMVLVTVCMLLVLIFVLMKTRENRLISAYKRPEEQLQTMLSRSIPQTHIDQLLREEKIEPALWKGCTIMIMEFEELDVFDHPKDRLDAVDRLFQEAENMFMEHGLQKVKTSGQQILAVCKSGKLTPVQQIENTIQCAIKLREATTKLEGHNMTVRAAVEYGDVISGIVGRQPLRFDIWGTGVNNAYQTFECADPGKIYISRYIMRALNKSKYTIEEAGTVRMVKDQTLEIFAV